MNFPHPGKGEHLENEIEISILTQSFAWPLLNENKIGTSPLSAASLLARRQ
jgi:hypothetical protein